MIEKGEVVQLFDVRLATPPHAYYVVHDRKARQRPEVDAFVGWLLQAYRNV
jgi:DNA-binding transcriptional LysR family regulator